MQPFPATGAKFQITRGPGPAAGQQNHHPIWSPNGREICYSNSQQLFAVSLNIEGGFAFANAVPLPVKGLLQNFTGPRQFDITPDGKQFVALFPPGQAQSSSDQRSTIQIQVVLNWFNEHRERVATK